MLRIAIAWLVLIGAMAWGAPVQALVPTDCTVTDCPELVVAGDAPAMLPNGQPSPFRGYADAVIRSDPDSGGLILAYSWPHMRKLSQPLGGRSFVPGVEVHWARSEDQGQTWKFQGVLWAPQPAVNPATGEQGHISAETPNLLHIGGNNPWIGVRLEYFLPDSGGYRRRAGESFRLVLLRGPAPDKLEEASAVRLGAAATAQAWDGVNLARLSPEVQGCTIWNEPALAFQDGRLYLALSCQAYRGLTPVTSQHSLVMFSAVPDGAPKNWSWAYAGKLAGEAEARALGAERLTQIELAKGRDGRLLAIVTPDVWAPGNKDFTHMGCVALEIASLSEAKLSRDAQGNPAIRARIAARPGGAGAPEDTAACAYDPASATGMLVGWRKKQGVSQTSAQGGAGAEFTVFQKTSGLHP